MKQEYIKATFVEESKQRFICTIAIDDYTRECYVSSSSKLSTYLPLLNCNVLISENKGLNLRTQYTLEAVEYEKTMYYVNFNKINQLYEKYVLRDEMSGKKVIKEFFAENLVKTDFYIEGIGCVEVKALLSIDNKIVFPDVSSKRIERQLLQYIELLKKGTNVTFAFVSMGSNLLEFELNTKREDVKTYLHKALSLGLIVKAYSVIYIDNEFKIIENISLAKNVIKAIHCS